MAVITNSMKNDGWSAIARHEVPKQSGGWDCFAPLAMTGVSSCNDKGVRFKKR